MNYAAIYTRLMLRAQARVTTAYTEKHHIQPRCMGGSDDSSNLAHLTPEEHFLAHQLLVKMYPTSPYLAYAACMMTIGATRQTNKRFGWLRRRMSAAARARPSPHVGTYWANDGVRSYKVRIGEPLSPTMVLGRIRKTKDTVACLSCGSVVLVTPRHQADHCTPCRQRARRRFSTDEIIAAFERSNGTITGTARELGVATPRRNQQQRGHIKQVLQETNRL